MSWPSAGGIMMHWDGARGDASGAGFGSSLRSSADSQSAPPGLSLLGRVLFFLLFEKRLNVECGALPRNCCEAQVKVAAVLTSDGC
jgi:hypothetical protein